MIAMKVSATATPDPETMPERRFFESVRWMQSTATGPTVIEAATPTISPRIKTSKSVTVIVENRILFAKIRKKISQSP